MEKLLDEKIEMSNNLEKQQNKFLNSVLGKTINTALDIGIKAILPEFVEDQVINIKNNLLKYGLSEGIKETINDAIDLGKSAVGVLTGEFENIDQMKDAIKEGGIIDGMSSVLDLAIDKITDKGIINRNISNVLSTGKDVLLRNVEENIEKLFDDQKNQESSIETNIKNWKKAYDNKDFDEMEKAYNKIENLMDKLAPIEKLINEARTIDTMHNLIKNNGHNFNLSEQEKELAQNL